MKTLFILLLVALSHCKHKITKKEIDKVLKEAMDEYKRLPHKPERKLAEVSNVSNYLIDQLQETQTTYNTMEGQNRIQNDIKLSQDWFEEISRSLLKYRDDMVKKLTEIKMSLARPKVPMIGLPPGLNSPYSFDNFGKKVNPYPNEFENIYQKIVNKAQKSARENKKKNNYGEDEEKLLK